MKPATAAANLVSVWHALLRRDPDRRLLIEGESGKTWTAAAIDALAAQRETRLRESGLHAGQLAVFTLPNSAEWIATFLAIRRLDAVAAPLDPGIPDGGQADTAAHLRAAVRINANGLTRLDGARQRRDRALGLVKLTSGSTGRPAAYFFHDDELLADARSIAATMRIGPEDLNYAAIPFGHSYGLGNLFAPLILQGTGVVCASSFLPGLMAAEIARFRATVLPAVPVLLKALAATARAEDLASLRLVISAGAPLSAELARQFETRFGRRIHGFYGSSETGGICFDRDGSFSLNGEGVGSPLDGVSVTLAAGGRVHVSSPAVYRHGNRRRAGAQAAVRLRDCAEWTPSGCLRLLARARPFVKIHGRRISLDEIERRLAAVPGVREACAFVDPAAPDELCAAVASALDRKQIREILSTRLPAWKIPKRILVLPDLPHTPRGKIDMAKLRNRVFGNAPGSD